MPYSNWRRHNSISIPQTPYQTLIILVPTLILFTKWFSKKIPMSGISPQQKKDPQRKNRDKKKERKRKKKGSEDWKAKEVKPHLKSSMFQRKRKKGGWNLQATRRDSIKRKNGDHIFV
jgi:hypothetical protein